ncbi:MAG: hypothetical protein ACXVH3_18380 [Solirubrobacteraceae bacterium]
MTGVGVDESRRKPDELLATLRRFAVETTVTYGVRERQPHAYGQRLHVASAAVWEPIPDDGLPRFPGALQE